MKKWFVLIAFSSILFTGCDSKTTDDYEFSLAEVKERVAPAKQTVLKCSKYVEQDDVEQARVCLDELRAVSGKGSAYQEMTEEFYQRGIDDSEQFNDPEYQAILKDMDQVVAGGMKVFQYVKSKGSEVQPSDENSLNE